MSYRGIKRVLGETRLEWKCRLLFGISLLFLVMASFLWYGEKTESIVYTKRREKGQLLVPETLTKMHFKSWDLDRRDGELAKNAISSPEKYELVINDLIEGVQTQSYTWRTIHTAENTPKAWGPIRPPYGPRDDFEREVLTRFAEVGRKREAGDRSAPGYVERSLPDSGEYQYFQPVFAKQSCAPCHELRYGKAAVNERIQAGDLLAVLVIQFSDEETHRALSLNRAFLYATAIITVFLAMILLYIVVRYVIVKPLKHLRDVADEVSRGNLDVRAHLRTSDEFEEVAEAFNRMLRHVLAAQQELRTVNQDLDVKLDQLAQANMQLHEMNRLKGDFLATMSHELRTPLNSIIGFSDVLSTIDSLEEKQRRYVRNIQKSGRMLLDMINDILDLAKIESGRMDVRLADFNIASAITAQCDMARPLAEKKNIDLNVEIADGLPPMHQDQAKIQQILSNLLSNAIKFTPEGGRIVVSAAEHDPQYVAVRVSDTGVGIAPEDQMAIFEKFRQGPTVISGDAMTREYSGTGLGLSIVKEMCKLLGGEVSVESELGKGSTFTVKLPYHLASRPHLISPMADDIDELTRPRLSDYTRPLEDEPAPVGH